MQKSKLQLKIKKHPDFNEEMKLWRQGCKFVVGLDEVGRGPLAGPVVAGAVCVEGAGPAFSLSAAHASPFASLRRLSLKSPPRTLMGIKDSKKLTAKQREEWYKILTGHPYIKWGIGMVSEKVVDKINIFEATKLAMKKAIEALEIEPDYLLIDGNFTLEDLNLVSQKAIVRGDEKVFSCAAASIIAKVTRDRMMCHYAKKYPQYGFETHKGYGTRRHFEAIKKHGPCPIHRRSFSPIKALPN